METDEDATFTQLPDVYSDGDWVIIRKSRTSFSGQVKEGLAISQRRRKVFPQVMDIDFRKLLRDPKLSALFQSQSGLNDDELNELLDENDPSTFWQWLELEETLVVHHRQGAGESCFGVYSWGGFYFCRDDDEGLLAGPFASPEESASKVSQLCLANLNDTYGLEFEVSSTLPTNQALSLLTRLISKGQTLELNGARYRLEAECYVRT